MYHSVKRCWRENLSLHLPDFKVLTLVMISYCFSDEWKMCQRKEENPGRKACYSGQCKQMPTEEYNLEHSQHRQGKKERMMSYLATSLEKTRCKNKIVWQECLS